MARPILKQQLTFSGNGTDQNCVAYFPNILAGQYVEWTVYIEFGANVTAGKLQIETAFAVDPVRDYSGTWAALGNTIDWAAATSQKYASVTGVYDLLRLRISTAVANGPVTAYVIAASHQA